MPTSQRRVLGAVILLASSVALWFLYGYGLDRAGMLGPDEPRYAAVGQAMAQSGDWVTPRLWGQPWFEKPALLYWMTGLGYKLGLGPDLAPRVPVALASVAFLVFFWFLVRREFGPREALYSTTILATSAGWLIYSHIAVTDLPLAVCCSIAMLLLLPGQRQTRAVWAGVFWGLSILAKGLVPVVLILPAFWFLRKQWRDLVTVLVSGLMVAAPWYGLVILRNGAAFMDEFFWKQHFARFTNGSLLHVRPVWFYLPVLLAGVFPWTPLLAMLCSRRLYTDRRTQFLLAWFAFGFVFFSASQNKLPGYLLPLLPAVTVLLGVALAQAGKSVWLLGVAIALLALIPTVGELLPAALLNGASHVVPSVSGSMLLLGVLAGASVIFLVRRDPQKKSVVMAVLMIAAGVTAGAVYLVSTTFPTLDRSVSAREFWYQHPRMICVDERTRSWRYGLNYYARKDLPLCVSKP